MIGKKAPGPPITAQAYYDSGAKVPRNGPCPCGSGKKFKHCCLHGIRAEVKELTILPRKTRAELAADSVAAAIVTRRLAKVLKNAKAHHND